MFLMLFGIAATAGRAFDNPAVYAQGGGDIDATVRANPLHIRIHTLGDTSKGCGPILAFVEIRNLADRRLTILAESLVATPPSTRVLRSIRLHGRVLPAKHTGVSVWILQPLHAGDVTLTASVRSSLRGDVFTSESAPKVVRVRPQCTRKG